MEKNKGKENKMASIRKKIKPVYIIIFCSFFMIFILNCLTPYISDDFSRFLGGGGIAGISMNYFTF